MSGLLIYIKYDILYYALNESDLYLIFALASAFEINVQTYKCVKQLIVM